MPGTDGVASNCVLSVLFATAISGMPSPLKSPTATNSGPTPVEYLELLWKVPSPFPRNTSTAL